MRFFVTAKLKGHPGTDSYLTAAQQRGHDLRFGGTVPSNIRSHDYVVSHPEALCRRRNALMETGFFHEGQHIDPCGLWEESALTGDGVRDDIAAFNAPVSARDVVFQRTRGLSKYAQLGERESRGDWSGVVLAAQKPRDRANTRCNAKVGYWYFVEAACRRYGEKVFMKLHPHADQLEERTHQEIAARHGAVCDFATIDVIDRAEFVLVYTSTFAVDAWLRGKRVAQVAPGYFHKTGAVTFTDGEIPEPGEVEDCTGWAHRVTDFLMWRYCYHRKVTPEWFVKILEAYGRSEERFPLPAELSYGAWMTRRAA